MMALVRRLLLLLLRLAMILATGAVLLFALVIASCHPRIRSTIVPSPDRNASLVIATDIGGGPTVPFVGEIFLVGRDRKTPVKLGDFVHGWPDIGEGWTDDTTVNVCSLRSDSESKVQLASLLAEDGVVRVYRITSICPPGILGRDTRPATPKGYDYDQADPSRHWR